MYFLTNYHIIYIITVILFNRIIYVHFKEEKEFSQILRVLSFIPFLNTFLLIIILIVLFSLI
jgi:hypothetical protein